MCYCIKELTLARCRLSILFTVRSQLFQKCYSKSVQNQNNMSKKLFLNIFAKLKIKGNSHIIQVLMILK